MHFTHTPPKHTHTLWTQNNDKTWISGEMYQLEENYITFKKYKPKMWQFFVSVKLS